MWLRLPGRQAALCRGLGELTVVVSADNYLDVMQTLRDARTASSSMLIDLCGVDYSTYRKSPGTVRALPWSPTCCR
jgi:NADH:ubiquinone oxidoreductase subunit C